MLRIYFFLFFLATCCACSQKAIGQQRYSAKHWGKEEKLSQENITGLLKDEKGFLWITTIGGLFRFDGNNFKLYLRGYKENKSLADGYLMGIVEDSLHNIWIGNSGGISRYDTKADTFTRFVHQTNLASENTFIVPFWATRTEVFCIEKLNTITSYNIHSYARKILLNNLETEYPGTDKAGQSVYDSASGSVLLLNGNNLLRVFLSTGRQKHYPLPVREDTKPETAEAPGMCYDPGRKCVWVSSQDAFLKFSFARDSLEKVPDLDRWIAGVYPGIAVDESGQIWIATLTKGIIMYNPADHSVTPLFANADQQMKVSENTGIIYPGNNGLMWLGKFSSGIEQLFPMPLRNKRISALPDFPLVLDTMGITGIAQGANGDLWIGSEHGLIDFRQPTGSLKIYRKKDMPGIGGENIYSLYVDTIKQKAWISIYRGGLYEMNLVTRACRPVIFKNELNQEIKMNNFWDIAFQPSKDGCMFKVLIDSGFFVIFSIDNDSAIAHHITSFARNQQITKIYNADDHYLFLKNFGSGNDLTYIRINDRWQLTPGKLDSIGWTEIAYQKNDQTYWAGVGWQIIHYNRNFDVIRSYAFNEVVSGDMVLEILPTRIGQVWFSTPESVARLSLKTDKIIALSEKDGYTKPKINWGSPSFEDMYGNIIILRDKGILTINPANLPESYPASSAYFKSLKINDHQLYTTEGINDVKILILPYDENNISIETGVIDYYSNGTNQIRYKMEGTNSVWQYAPPEYLIRYEQLSPNDYTLIIQASNAAQEWGSEKKLIIKIKPPFWETWWFRTMAVIFALVLMYGIYLRRTSSLRKQKSALEEIVMQRTAVVISQKKEIEDQRDKVVEAMDELKTTQKQLIQSEKMASLGELTAGIAHEIQNPLNFVNNFSEVNRELVEELQQELKEGKIADAMAISNDIKDNEDKIGHHGRRADAIVRGMLQHSRISSGVKESTDLNALADEYLRLSYHGLRAKDNSFNATMKTDFDQNIGQINIVPQDIGRVLLNVYNNAFFAVREKKNESTDDYEPAIFVSTKRIKDVVEISVKDNGSGIPQKVLNKIFQPFFTTKPAGQGTGLGLSLSYEIVKAHGGEIIVNTRDGEFTEFVIQLPAV